MALYYFDLRDGDELILDEEGTELFSIDEVQTEAAFALADLLYQLRTASGDGHARDLIIGVRDELGAVMRVRFSFEIERNDRSVL